MKIIDLLNKIANGEEVPKKIEYRGTKFLYDILNQCYIEENYNKYNDLLMELSDHKGTELNYEVEIIEEDKEIEKIDVIPYEKCIHEVTHKEKEILLKIRDIQINFNKIIDYLMEEK